MDLLYGSHSVKSELYQLADHRLVVRIAVLEVSVGNGAADGTCLMPKMCGQTCDSRTLHLEIGDAIVTESEGLERIEHVRHCKRNSHDTSLRTIKSLC